MEERNKLARFERLALPHMNAAYNLARWLVRHDHDAQDIVQEAYLKAFRFFDSLRGDDARAWLLSIVRNTCYSWLQQNRAHELNCVFDDDTQIFDFDDNGLPRVIQARIDAASLSANPETLLLQEADEKLLRQALEELPVEFREVMILRELEDLSYKQIAAITQTPVGTVMSRLARARKRLRQGNLMKSSGRKR